MDDAQTEGLRFSVENDNVWVRSPEFNLKLGAVGKVCDEMCRFMESIDYCAS